VKPEKLLYATTHEWVAVETDQTGAKVATLGISAFAFESLNDLIFIELPTVGREVKAGEAVAKIESVKAISDIHSPVDGQVIEVNSDLLDNLDDLADDPYESGWFVKVKIDNDSGLTKLLDHAAYQKQCEEDGD